MNTITDVELTITSAMDVTESGMDYSVESENMTASSMNSSVASDSMDKLV